MPCTAEAALKLRTGSVTLDDEVDEHDHVHLGVRMLPILPDGGQQLAILQEELERVGWTKNADGTMTKELEGGVTATLEADGSRVRLETKGSAEVTATGEGEARVAEGQEAEGDELAQKRAQTEAEQLLADAREKARQRLVKENAQRILERAPEVEKELKGAVNRTTKRALEQRAATLGSIESSSETGGEGNYGLEIVVRT